MLKGLPVNTRAASLCAQCGFEADKAVFYGDVFVGRVAIRPIVHNVDFKLDEDMDGGAEWVKRAVGENVAWHKAMQQARPAAAVDGADGNAKEEAGGQFSWTQSDDEVEIVVPLVKDWVKGKVKVVFAPQALTVIYDDEGIFQLKLHGKVDLDGCTWTKDGANLVVSLEKEEQGKNWQRVADSQ
jgi:hypothetical protein